MLRTVRTTAASTSASVAASSSSASSKQATRKIRWGLLVAFSLLCGMESLRSTRYLKSRLSFDYRDDDDPTTIAAVDGDDPTTADGATTAGGSTATTTTTASGGGGDGPEAVDCRTLPVADHDPNKDLEEDPKRLVDLVRDDPDNVVPTPEFWIALHVKSGDYVRWKSIMDKGVYYETGITRIFQEILRPSAPKGIVMDVGMNIGWFTVLSRAMGHEVIGFDPNPIMHSRVCSSIAYNRWWDPTAAGSGSGSGSSGVETYLYGLGDRPGTLGFAVGANPGGGSLVPGRKKTIQKKVLKTFEVPVTTLDRLASDKGWLAGPDTATAAVAPPPIIHLLKIDVEGFEPHVIAGAKELIGTGAIRNVLHENSHGGTTEAEGLENVRSVFEGLWEAGYEIHEIVDGRGSSRDRYMELARSVDAELRNGTFAGSEVHRALRTDQCNVWWKKKKQNRLDDEEGSSSSSSSNNVERRRRR